MIRPLVAFGPFFFLRKTVIFQALYTGKERRPKNSTKQLGSPASQRQAMCDRMHKTASLEGKYDEDLCNWRIATAVWRLNDANLGRRSWQLGNARDDGNLM
jgi:hypothetical protein